MIQLVVSNSFQGLTVWSPSDKINNNPQTAPDPCNLKLLEFFVFVCTGIQHRQSVGVPGI